MPSLFNFYQAAYKINQGIGTTTLSLSDIKMGSDTTTSYDGLAFYLTKGFYADLDSVVPNRNLFANYSGKFDTSVPGKSHSATILADCNFGPAVPNLNDYYDSPWDETCYPSALGDTRDNLRYGNLRDGSWVEAGYVATGQPTGNFINIYTANPNTFQEPIWLNSHGCSNQFAATFPNCRVFTSPSFMTDYVPALNLAPGLVLIAYFAWSPTGSGSGGQILYYELFGWDPGTNILGTITTVDITNTYAGYYTTFFHTGKHDMFHTAPRNSPQNYIGCDFLSVLTNDGWLVQFDVASGDPVLRERANAGAYSDVYDVFALVNNSTSTFFTITGRVGLMSFIDTEIAPVAINIFDADYRPFPTLSSGTQDNYFYFGDDPQTARGAGTVIGWSLEINSAGQFSTAALGVSGLRSAVSTPLPSPTTFPLNLGLPYILKRVVVVSPMQLILGSGPSYGTYPLIRITCNYSGGSWYRSSRVVEYGTGTHNEDYIAMFHGFCEDYLDTFDSSGSYPIGIAPAYTDGLPVGAGNGHLLTVSYNMNLSLHNHNTTSTFFSQNFPGAVSGHYKYALYLGKSANANSPTGEAYYYINITGGGGFHSPFSTLPGPAFFITTTGNLRLLSFHG